MNTECGISRSFGIENFRVPFVVSFELGHLSPMWPTFVSDHSTQNSNLIKYSQVTSCDSKLITWYGWGSVGSIVKNEIELRLTGLTTV